MYFGDISAFSSLPPLYQYSHWQLPVFQNAHSSKSHILTLFFIFLFSCIYNFVIITYNILSFHYLSHMFRLSTYVQCPNIPCSDYKSYLCCRQSLDDGHDNSYIYVYLMDKESEPKELTFFTLLFDICEMWFDRSFFFKDIWHCLLHWDFIETPPPCIDRHYS